MSKNTKTLLLIIRWVVGLLFIFSGLVKANDPLGLSYKMQEFFEAWNLSRFNEYTLALSLFMNAFEVLAGVAVIIGWRMNLFSWLLLLLIIFFSFLTGYALFSGKIKTCGCFGDCLPLTPAQSFTKDLILFVLILVLFIYRKKIKSEYPFIVAGLLLPLTVMILAFFQQHVLEHLPVVDCLPYKKGNNIIQQMKPPANAIRGSVAMVFIYKKDGQELKFTADKLPADLDSTYEFVDRKDEVVRKGNAVPPITDFALFDVDGNDVTQQIFQTPKCVWVMAKDMQTEKLWNNNSFHELEQKLHNKNIPIYIVTADKSGAQKIFDAMDDVRILLCDATVIKTAARVNATYFIMNGATVEHKFAYVNLDVNKVF